MLALRVIVFVAVVCFNLGQANAQLQCFLGVASDLEAMSTRNETTCSPGRICTKVAASFETILLPITFELSSCREEQTCDGSVSCEDYFDQNFGAGVDSLGFGSDISLTSCEQVCCNTPLCNTGDISQITPAVPGSGDEVSEGTPSMPDTSTTVTSMPVSTTSAAKSWRGSANEVVFIALAFALFNRLVLNQ